MYPDFHDLFAPGQDAYTKTVKKLVVIILTCANSWKEAKEIAEKECKELVFHNYDKKEYGACSRETSFGCFKEGKFTEERCICIPARFSADEIEQKEREFLEQNPEWLGES